LPSIGCSTMCGRLMPTMLTPSAGSVLVELHSSAPPPPALYWITVSMAGHFFFSTSCWWRADRSDSPPGGNACQYMMFALGQAIVCANAGAAASSKTASSERAMATPRAVARDLLIRRRACRSEGTWRRRVVQVSGGRARRPAGARISHRERPPLAGDALQRMRAAVAELDRRTGHEVLDGARHQHLRGPRAGHDARCDVDRDPACLLAR